MDQFNRMPYGNTPENPPQYQEQPQPQAPQYPIPPQPPVQQPASAYMPPYYALGRYVDVRRAPAARTCSLVSLLVFSQFGLSLLLSFVMAFAAALFGLLFTNTYLFTDVYILKAIELITYPMVNALPVFIYVMISKMDISYMLRFKKVPVSTALLAVLAGLAVALMGNYPSMLIQNILGYFGYSPNQAAEPGTPFDFVLNLFSIAVLPAVFEELIFRGAVMGALRRYGNGIAVIGSSLIFALAHMDVSTVVFAFIAGLAMGYIYLCTDNLWICVAVHFLNNALAVSGSYVPGFFPEEISWLSGIIFMLLPIVLGLISMVLLLLLRKDVFIPKRDMWAVPGVSVFPVLVRSAGIWVMIAASVIFTALSFI